MIVLTLCTGERAMVNESKIECVKEGRDEGGVHVCHVYTSRVVLKVRNSLEEIARLLVLAGTAFPLDTGRDVAAPAEPLRLDRHVTAALSSSQK